MSEYIRTGIKGLDSVLYGGYPKGSTIIIEGAPGTGKTTLGFQFLYEGAMYEDEPGIYITFEELPGQLYQDMMAFNWDIRQLEKENKIRIISISPEVLVEQMLQPNSFIESMMKDMGCKRIVVDSLNLLPDSNNEEFRSMLYRFRNTLRKYGLTSLLIREQTNLDSQSVPFAHYVVDGVIRLSLQEFMENYRKRTLEVFKMRGTKMLEGEHVYRITDQGIHLIPARSMVEDVNITSNDFSTVPSGIKELDRFLGGGIRRGSVFLIDTNSKANYKYLVASIITNRLLAGKKGLIMPSSISSVNELAGLYQLYDVNLMDYIEKKHVYILEEYRKPVDKEYTPNVINTAGLDNDEFMKKLKSELSPIIEKDIKGNQPWFTYYDLNTIFTQRGKDFVTKFFAEEAAEARTQGFTMIALCNFKEIGQETASYLERTSNGVIRTWVDGNYQYLQVTKSPTGQMSEPYLVENIEEKPFIRLV